MLQKIFASVTALAFTLVATLPAFGQQIPAGYALVPISALSAQPTYAAAQTPYVQPVATVSPERSALRTTDGLGFVGGSVNVTATLRDATGRVIANHPVTLTSSRTGDIVTPTQTTTNASGEATFRVSGKSEGVATFTAIDQTGVAIGERPRVVFLNRKAVGGNKIAAVTTTTKKLNSSLFRADAAAVDTTATESTDTTTAIPTTDTTTVATATPTTAATINAYNEFIQIAFPDTVAVNEPNDITVSITDADGTIVDGYVGTISFTSTDPAAIVGQEIPLSFDFTADNHGTHTFAKAVTFVTPGRLTLSVSASTDTTGPASKNIVVLGTTGADATTEAPTITSPTDGFTTNETITLTGSGPANVNISAFVDDQQALTGSTDETGAFTFEIKKLKDGDHSLTVAVMDDAGQPAAMSASVNVTIDATPPELLKFKLLPGETVPVGTKVSVGMKSEPHLATATLKSKGQTLIAFKESTTTPGLYTGTLNADAIGAYPLAVYLRDAVGNGATTDAATLTVEVPVTITPTAEPQSARVDLKWEAPSNATDVDHYLIHYGTIKGKSDKTFATTDNQTAWFIGELNNDTAYYFTIESVDAKGAVNGRSEEVSATPKELINLTAKACDSAVIVSWLPQTDSHIVRYQVGYGVKSQSYLESIDAPLGETSVMLPNLINGVPYHFGVRGVDENGTVIFAPTAEATATPGGAACGHASASTETPIELWQKVDDTGRMFLAWNAVPNANTYRIYAGTQPNVYDLPTATVTTTYLRPTGLTPGVTYYFAVKAVTDSGHEAATTSNVVQFNVLQTEVGPAETTAISLGIAFLASAAWFVRRQFAENA